MRASANRPVAARASTGSELPRYHRRVSLTKRLGTAARTAADAARARLGNEPGAIAPEPDGRGNRPRAAFAGVLDGRHLWLAVDATPGSLALRHQATQEVVTLHSDLTEDDPRWRSVRASLSGLTGGDATYDVVVVAPGGRVHGVWTPPLPRNEPVVTPVADGVRWRVDRASDGALLLQRHEEPTSASLLDISMEDDRVKLTIADAEPGAELVLLDDDNDAEVARIPLNHSLSDAVAVITPSDVPDRLGLSAKVMVGGRDLRRRANELVRPDTAVLLPQHQADDGQSVALVYRWLPDETLRIRRPKAGTP